MSAGSSTCDKTRALPVLLDNAPHCFRSALKKARVGADVSDELGLLAYTAHRERDGRRACSAEDRCICGVLAREAHQLTGTHSWMKCADHVMTIAQAECHVASICSWLAACESLTVMPKAITEGEFKQPSYVRYDAECYDFRGIVLRMLYDDYVLSMAADGDPLATLHDSPAGRCELGTLGGALEWAANGLTYSKELDEATRYGCGVFNRVWKSSALREEFLELYERFMREVIAPLLDSPGLIYQAVPVFRVYLPHHLGVGPRHTDSSYHEQPNELNFWVPLTEVYGTNSLQVESSAGAGDFEPICAGPGTMYHFRGNSCEHYTSLNVSGATRVSFDFRVIRTQELSLQPVSSVAGAGSKDHGNDKDGTRRTRGANEYFQIGRYYKAL